MVGGCDTRGEQGSDLVNTDYRGEIDPQQSAAVAVVEAVSAADDVSSFDLEPIAETLDPDALDQLLQGADSDIRVEFSYVGYQVVLTESHVELHSNQDG